MPSLYEQQYNECRALYEQEKFAECIKLGEYNLTDPGLSPYLRIKTLCMLAGAAEEWPKAEKYRLDAEDLYRSRYRIIQERKGSLPDDPSLVHDIKGLNNLRITLDEVCHYQAKYAPEKYPIQGARYPLREGNVKDVIAWRKWRVEQSSDEEDEGDEPMEDVVNNTAEMGESTDFEADDDDIPLEDAAEVEAAEKEVFGEDVNIIDAMAKAILDEEGASEQMAAKDSEHASPDKKASKALEGKQGLRSKVVGFADKVKGKGTSKLDKKASTKSLRRQPSTMSLTKPAWRPGGSRK